MVTAGDLAGLRGGEAGVEHRRNEVHPLCVILDATARVELVGVNADMLDAGTR
jgi:hypothetical protein